MRSFSFSNYSIDINSIESIYSRTNMEEYQDVEKILKKFYYNFPFLRSLKLIVLSIFHLSNTVLINFEKF